MSSTEEEKLRSFYEARLVPAAARMRARGRSFFALGPTEAASWYETPLAGEELAEFEVEDFERRLRVLWQNDPELIELVTPIMELSRELEPKLAENDDVSPFIYVMF